MIILDKTEMKGSCNYLQVKIPTVGIKSKRLWVSNQRIPTVGIKSKRLWLSNQRIPTVGIKSKRLWVSNQRIPTVGIESKRLWVSNKKVPRYDLIQYLSIQTELQKIYLLIYFSIHIYRTFIWIVCWFIGQFICLYHVIESQTQVF